MLWKSFYAVAKCVRKMFLRGLASPGARQTAFGGRECRGEGGYPRVVAISQKLEPHSSKGGKKSASRGSYFWIKVDFLQRIRLKNESDDE